MNPSTTFRTVSFAAFLVAAGPALALAQGGAATSQPTNTTGMPTTGSSSAMSTSGAQTAPAQPRERGAMMQGMMGGEMPGREMGEHRRGMMMMAHTGAAIFRMRRGDNSIFIKCAENESMQACITAAGTLLDKLNSEPKP